MGAGGDWCGLLREPGREPDRSRQHSWVNLLRQYPRVVSGGVLLAQCSRFGGVLRGASCSMPGADPFLDPKHQLSLVQPDRLCGGAGVQSSAAANHFREVISSLTTMA